VNFNFTQWITLSGGFGVILTILLGTLLIAVGYGFSIKTYLPTLGVLMFLMGGRILWQNKGKLLVFTVDISAILPKIERLIPLILLFGLLIALTIVFPLAPTRHAHLVHGHHGNGQRTRQRRSADHLSTLG